MAVFRNCCASASSYIIITDEQIWSRRCYRRGSIWHRVEGNQSGHTTDRYHFILSVAIKKFKETDEDPKVKGPIQR